MQEYTHELLQQSCNDAINGTACSDISYTFVIVGSPQVSFPMCTLEIPQKIAVQVLLLLTLFTFTFEPFLKL